MRDPAARAWETWDSAGERELLKLPDGAEVETWCDVLDVSEPVSSGPLVDFAEHARFLPGKDVLTSTSRLRFRGEADLRSSLHAAGFEAKQLFGGWHGERVGKGCGELVVVARKSG